jgi:hypothetical protein
VSFLVSTAYPLHELSRVLETGYVYITLVLAELAGGDLIRHDTTHGPPRLDSQVPENLSPVPL